MDNFTFLIVAFERLKNLGQWKVSVNLILVFKGLNVFQILYMNVLL
jgi:hypothetical protein